MGYFKSVEQLLHKLLTKHGFVDTDGDATIGDMALYYRDNRENGMVNKDLDFYTQKFIREAIFDFKNLRNGYSHKDNIHIWETIDYIHDEAYKMIFLLLGSFNLSAKDLQDLGYYEEVRSEYYKLCEYVNFHHNELFYLDFGDGNEEIGFGVCDTKSTIDDEGHVNYTGVYFKEIRENGRIVRFLEDQLPNKITLGKFVFSQSEMIDVKQVKVKTVFENGIFVGPSIAAEEKLDY